MTHELTPEQRERKRQKDREAVAAKRAAMTPEERAAARLRHDESYRDAHREQRRQYDRERKTRIALDPARRQARPNTEGADRA